MIKKCLLTLAVGAMMSGGFHLGTAAAQNVVGDHAILDGGSGNPFVRFEQADGVDMFLATSNAGMGAYFQETNSYPFYINEDSPSNSLRLSNLAVDVATRLDANSGLQVTGVSSYSEEAKFLDVITVLGDATFDQDTLVKGSAVIDGKATINTSLTVNGGFLVEGDNSPDFRGTSNPSLNLWNSNDSSRASLIKFTDGLGLYQSTSGYPFYSYDKPLTGQLTVRGNKNVAPGVGIGTTTPQAELHVYADGSPYAEAEFIVENNIATVAIREMFQLINNGGVRFAMENTDTGDRWDFTNNTIGDFLVNLAGSGGPEMTLTKQGRFFTGPAGFKAFDARPNGNVWIAGTYNQTSDRTKKENFKSVDSETVLEKLISIPVTTWNYKTDDGTVRHMGPMAQDFHAAFELGESNKVIALADMFGVSVSAIKALHTELSEKDAEIASLRQAVKAQAALMAEQTQIVEQRMEALETMLLNQQR